MSQQAEIRRDVYLVDANSTDGTGLAVAECHPEVRVIPTDSHQYWAGGMRAGFDQALKD